MSDRATRQALIQAHVAVLLAGATGLFGKLLTVGPEVITCARSLLGGLALLLAAVATGRPLRPRSRRVALLVIASGALLAIHWISFFRSIQVSTVAIGLLTLATFPVLVTFLEPWFFAERLRGLDVLNALVVAAGLALVTPGFDLAQLAVQGVLWGLLASASCAGLTLLGRAAVRHAPPLSVACLQQTTAGLLTLPPAWPSLGHLSPHDLGLLLILGILLTGLAHSLLMASLRHLPGRTASVLFGLESVYGIALAWLLLSETPSARTLLGALVIALAVLSATRSRPTHPPEAPAEEVVP